jgi:uncharacterized membrane protein YwaF
MPGALFALLFPGWTGSPADSFFSLNSFFVHTLLFAYPLTLLFSRILTPSVKRLPLCLGLIMLAAAPIYFLDKAVGANFFFLNFSPPGSPLEFFDRLWGRPWYIMGFAPILAAVWAVQYLPCELIMRGRAKRGK